MATPDATAYFRLVTYNLFHHAPSWPERAPHAIRGLAALAPSVVALQEVGVPDEQTGPLATALAAGSESSWAAASAVVHRADGWSEGLATLSAFPIADSGSLDPEGAGTACLWTRLLLARERPFDVFSVHLNPHDAALRGRQMAAILRFIDERAPAAILCGDFNAAPGGSTVARVRAAGFRSAHAERHGREPERTFPTTLRPDVYAARAGVCLDYIFLRGAGLGVRACRPMLGEARGGAPPPSDHAALVADLTWTPG